MEVSFKYDIGDVVTLVKLPDRFDNNRNLSWSYKRLDEFSPKQYKIKGYSFTILEDGTYGCKYSLDAYRDDWLDYHNWLTEDYFEGEGTRHNKDVCFKSADGDDLNIGDVVYTSLYYGSDATGIRCSVSGTFARKIRVTELIYTNEKFRVPTEKLIGDIIKEFYLPINGSLKKGCEFCNCSLKNITEQFICDFVKTCKEYRINPRNEKLSDYKSRKFWLDELGIFDDVCKRYNSRPKKMSSKKTSVVEKSFRKSETDKKVKDILSGMTDDEKREMLKLLTEEK